MKERAQVEEKLRRLVQLYKELLIEESEYRETRALLKKQLTLLTLPENRELIEAGQYLESLAPLWEGASLKEKRELTRVMVRAIYIDVEEVQIVSIEPYPVFTTLLEEVCANVGIEIVK